MCEVKQCVYVRTRNQQQFRLRYVKKLLDKAEIKLEFPKIKKPLQINKNAIITLLIFSYCDRSPYTAYLFIRQSGTVSGFILQCFAKESNGALH